MPRLAFIPGPVAEVEGRSFRNLRPRQVKGLAAGVGMAAAAATLLGWGSAVGMAATFLAAVPGFLFGFLQIQGRPVEWWLRLTFRYYTQPEGGRAVSRGGARDA